MGIVIPGISYTRFWAQASEQYVGRPPAGEILGTSLGQFSLFPAQGE